MTLDGNLIRETLAGYERASEVTEYERRERLRNLTTQESLSIYEGLVETWLQQFGKILETPEVEERFERIWRRAKTR